MNQMSNLGRSANILRLRVRYSAGLNMTIARTAGVEVSQWRKKKYGTGFCLSDMAIQRSKMSTG